MLTRRVDRLRLVWGLYGGLWVVLGTFAALGYVVSGLGGAALTAVVATVVYVAGAVAIGKKMLGPAPKPDPRDSSTRLWGLISVGLMFAAVTPGFVSLLYLIAGARALLMVVPMWVAQMVAQLALVAWRDRQQMKHAMQEET